MTNPHAKTANSAVGQRKGETMTQLESVLKRLRKSEREHYKFIADRYKDPQDRVDRFVSRMVWFVAGIFTGLIIAGLVAGITH